MGGECYDYTILYTYSEFDTCASLCYSHAENLNLRPFFERLKYNLRRLPNLQKIVILTG